MPTFAHVGVSIGKKTFCRICIALETLLIRQK